MSNRKGAEHTQEHLAERFRQSLTSGVGRSRKHESADKHVSGEAQYIDDRLEFPNQLHLAARLSRTGSCADRKAGPVGLLRLSRRGKGDHLAGRTGRTGYRPFDARRSADGER
jgi:hypothetical protein